MSGRGTCQDETLESIRNARVFWTKFLLSDAGLAPLHRRRFQLDNLQLAFSAFASDSCEFSLSPQQPLVSEFRACFLECDLICRF